MRPDPLSGAPSQTHERAPRLRERRNLGVEAARALVHPQLHVTVQAPPAEGVTYRTSRRTTLLFVPDRRDLLAMDTVGIEPLRKMDDGCSLAHAQHEIVVDSDFEAGANAPRVLYDLVSKQSKMKWREVDEEILGEQRGATGSIQRPALVVDVVAVRENESGARPGHQCS